MLNKGLITATVAGSGQACYLWHMAVTTHYLNSGTVSFISNKLVFHLLFITSFCPRGNIGKTKE